MGFRSACPLYMVTMANKRQTKKGEKITLYTIVTASLLFVGFIIYRLMKFNLTDIDDNKLTTRNDSQGLGHYGAPRTHGTHKGHDFLIAPNKAFKLPFTAIVLRRGLVSVGKPHTLIEVTPKGVFKNLIKIKLMYANTGSSSSNSVGYEVPKGLPIGISENVASWYGGGMKNHLHVEVRIGNKLINPNLIFNT